MQEKERKNLNNKKYLQNLLMAKNPKSIKSQNINLQTITNEKSKKYFTEQKKFFSSKCLQKMNYLNYSSMIYNLDKKNYYLNDDEQISFFDSSESERAPSPINSLNSSKYEIYSNKKRKQKGHQKKRFNKKKFRDYYYIYNSNIIDKRNNNNIYLNSSSSSSSSDIDDYSDSSDNSFKNKENKKKIYFDKMMVDENEFDYLRKSEVGLISSEEEENNIRENNTISIEENFNNEIERMLIEIYNKNISLISSKNYSEINKNNKEIEEIQKQIKNYLKKESIKTNLLVLKILGNKIKELIIKYKEKIFEIEEIKEIYQANELKRQALINNQIVHCNNSVGSNVATNSNSSYDNNDNIDNSYNEEEYLLRNNILLNVQDEITEKGISHILLRELINIKKTLKISSKEIEKIFRYPLSILRNDSGKKIKFSIELMQYEEFCNILLKDDLISILLVQIKEIFYQIKVPKIFRWIKELIENTEHKNEMTRFMKFINEKLGKENNNELDNNEIEKNKLSENKEEQDKMKEEKISNRINKNEKYKTEEIYDKEMNFKDIDELLNYINDEKDCKKVKKKGRKGKKNKKQNNSIKEEKKEEQLIIDNNNLDDIYIKEFADFKKNILENSINKNNINKIIPCLSDDFLKKID
jgi:hypothetical protein